MVAIPRSQEDTMSRIEGMVNSRIKDLPSFKKLLTNAQNLEQLAKVVSMLGPMFKLLGVDSEQKSPEIAAICQQVEEFVTIPDRFNDLFTSRGWIMYDYLNLDVAKSAIAKAAAGDLDGAEQVLVEYYDEKTVSHQITWLAGLKAFHPRLTLARKALTDYAEGRYHACAPVTLMLLDGMVDDLGIHGFFAEGTDLAAWDSVAAHSKGLAALAKVLAVGRFKTTTEQLSIPYRHGILHGHDLGYDNKLVAAKAWAALFAAGELARKVERGERTAPPSQPKLTWRDVLQQMKDTQQTNAQIAAWRARSIRPGTDIPATGEPKDYSEGTPEHTLVAFLWGWQRRNYGQMAQCLRGAKDQYQISKLAGDMRKIYVSQPLHSFELLELRDEAPAVTVIKSKLIYEQQGKATETTRDFRLINEDAEGHGTVRGKPGSRWVIYSPYV